AFEEPVTPRRLEARLPVDLEKVVLKAMAKEPAERYHSAKDLAGDLRRFLDGRPVQARRPGRGQAALRWGRRRIALVALVAVALVFASLTLAVGALYRAAADRAQAVEEIAVVQQFYRQLSETKEPLRRREPGWTWDVLREVEQAATFPEAR